MKTATRREIAENNRESRTFYYMKASVAAAIGAFTPMLCFLDEAIINAPEPICITYKGMHEEPAPVYDSHPVYDLEWASLSDQLLSFAEFLAGVPAAAAVGALFFCIARFIADPVMYQIDLRCNEDSAPAVWAKRFIVTSVVLLYLAAMGFAISYESPIEDEYVWMPLGDNEIIRVDREDYEKSDNSSENSEAEEKESATDSKKKRTETKESKEETDKTPVERGYPSNDMQYYIDHPNEEMPQELLDEITGGYDPGDYYDLSP